MAKNAKGYRFTFERKGLWLWEAFQHVYYQGKREGIVQSARGPHAEFEAERKTRGWREIGKGQVVQDHIVPITMVSIVYVTPLDGKQGEAFRNVYIEQRLESRASTCKKGYKEELWQCSSHEESKTRAVGIELEVRGCIGFLLVL